MARLDKVSDSTALLKVSGQVVADLNRHLDNGTSVNSCLLYTSPSPRDRQKSRMPSSA